MVVSIPAKLFSPTEDKRVSFHQLHGECGSRLQMPKWCPNCNRKVESAEVKKGYEVAKGQNIMLEDTDFQNLPLKSLKSIEIVEFVQERQIDIRAFADYYFLSCEDIGAKPFALLMSAMKKADLMAIAKLCYREREHLSAIRPYNGIMLLHTLHYADELRPYEEIRPAQVSLSEKDSELAQMLVDRMRGDFDLSKYHDDYREALERMIEAKLMGKTEAVITEPEKAPVADVAQALMQSLEMLGVKK